MGINNRGDIVGYVQLQNSISGFLYSGGAFTTVLDPSGTPVQLITSINDRGQMVGVFQNGQAFVLTDGSFTTISDPKATRGTSAQAINDRSQIVGYYDDAKGAHAFLYEDGAFTDIANPSDLSVGNTLAFGINNRGEIVGTYDAGAHGFLLIRDCANHCR
jgi:probable HAF family extracellular repeat protein